MLVDNLSKRLGVFVRLSEGLQGNLGRTSLMKLCYFLQSVRGVPPGYDFSLYSYGPFDSDVLSDLQLAENVNVLQAEIEYYPGGYKYNITPSEKSEKAKELAKDFLSKYKRDIEWVTQLFGNMSAGDLELLSTTLFVYNQSKPRHVGDLVERVNSIKPHFSPEQIASRIDWLRSQGLLETGTRDQISSHTFL